MPLSVRIGLRSHQREERIGELVRPLKIKSLTEFAQE